MVIHVHLFQHDVLSSFFQLPHWWCVSFRLPASLAWPLKVMSLGSKISQDGRAWPSTMSCLASFRCCAKNPGWLVSMLLLSESPIFGCVVKKNISNSVNRIMINKQAVHIAAQTGLGFRFKTVNLTGREIWLLRDGEETGGRCQFQHGVNSENQNLHCRSKTTKNTTTQLIGSYFQDYHHDFPRKDRILLETWNFVTKIHWNFQGLELQARQTHNP